MEHQQLAASLVVLAQGSDQHVSIIRGIDGHDGHERWRFETERDHFVPINALAADNGVVYAATSEGLVYALSAVDGDLVWQRRVTGRHPDNRRPGALRVVAGGGIVAVSAMRPDLRPTDTRHITLLNGQDGTELWVWHPPRYPLCVRLWNVVRRLNSKQRAGFVLLGVDRQGVYVTTASERHPPTSDRLRTILLGRMSGKPQWRTRQAAAANYAGHWGSRTSVALGSKTAYTIGERLSALDTSNGRARWSCPIPSGEGVRPGPLVADESVLCAAYDSRFCVYRAHDGELLWQLVSSRDPVHVGSFLGMVLMDDAVYVSRSKYQSFGVEAHDALTGELRWEWPRPDASSETASLARGDISWRLVGAGGILYVPGPACLCAVRASDGELLWQLPKVGGLPPLVAVAV
ncbi:MAG TPA: PQQ-binding-like beta-propeller repeat protein [Ktedonobacterales bacterium]|jgi:outer membrane protein assembly factor BamB